MRGDEVAQQIARPMPHGHAFIHGQPNSWVPLSGKRNENAVAFAKAGNAKLNKTGPRVNDGEQMLKMRESALTEARAA